MTDSLRNDPSYHRAFAGLHSVFTAQHPHNDKPFMVAAVGRCLMTLRECDLDVEQATALRDWLNKVLP